MSARRNLSRSFGFLGALASVGLLVLLLTHRPPLPALPRSPENPITPTFVQAVLVVAVWGGTIVLAALLLGHSFHQVVAGRTRRALPVPRRRHRSTGQARLAAGASRADFPPPFPLVVRARAERSSEPHALALALAPAREGVVAFAARGIDVQRQPPLRRSPPKLPRPSISLLGPLTITPSRPSRRGLRSQTQQLLAYLALHPEGVTADEVIGVFWPDVDDHKAHKQLWRSITDARAKLGEVILRADSRYLLDRDALAVDLDLFERLLAEAAAAEDADREQLLEHALALVRGQPFAGSDYPWAAGEIRRLRGMIIEPLEQLGYLRLDNGNPAGALAAAEQAIALEPYHEGAHRLAMHAEAVLGLREALAERFERLNHELDTRFGLEPERETRLLYRRLLTQDVADS